MTILLWRPAVFSRVLRTNGIVKGDKHMRYNGRWRNLLIILGTSGVVYISFYYLLPLVVPFVFAFVFARAIRPVVEKLHRFSHINEKVCTVLIVVLMLGAAGCFLFYIGYICIGQLTEMLRHTPAHMGGCMQLCRRACTGMDNLLGLGAGESYAWVEGCISNMDAQISSTYIPKLTGYIPGMLVTLGEWGVGFVVFIMATLLISFDRDNVLRYRSLMPYIRRLKETGFAYLKAQGIIIFIVATVSALGLYIMGSNYAILFGIVIGVVDAFPVLGSGSIFVPWAVFQLVQRDYYQGAVLLTLYVITMLIREIMEPRLMGKELGLKPLYMLISVYVGIKLFGIGGILLGPIGLTILKTTAETSITSSR